MIYKIAIDADSLLYKACYNSQLVNLKGKQQYTDEEREQSFNLEEAYSKFCHKIESMKDATYKRISDEVIDDDITVQRAIVFSPKKTFRNDLSPTEYDETGKPIKGYKHKRKPSTIVGISELKKLVQSRLDTIEKENVEADDVVIWLAMHHGYDFVGAMDKDIWSHCPVPCLNYNKWEWVEAKSQDEIDEGYVYQSIMGDSTDGISGAKGKGKKFAQDFIDHGFGWTYDDWEMCFASREEALLNMQLVRMDQLNKEGELVLWQKM